MMHVGDILSTVGDVQYHGGYHDKCGGYLEWGRSVLWGGGVILSTVGDIIMSTVRGFSTVGENLLLFEYPHGTEHSHSTHDIPPRAS